jgi:glycosyltransferase involved in cell wall biosynthesis
VAEMFDLPTFDPHSVADMARAIEEMATNRYKRNAIIDKIKKIKAYTWKDYANDFLKSVL